MLSSAAIAVQGIHHLVQALGPVNVGAAMDVSGSASAGAGTGAGTGAETVSAAAAPTDSGTSLPSCMRTRSNATLRLKVR